MVKKNIEDLKGNEVLAKPIITWDYQIIMPQGAIIKVDYMKKLKELGITEVYVKDEERTQEMSILKSDIEESVKVKVKDILERHTYKHNKELQELSVTADNIITNILEDERVVEKVFDIRERSADIYEHSISVCSFSILTALKLGLDKDIVHDIGVGCLLHDIGMRYLTTDLIGKDFETLTQGEQQEYKKHPIYGYSAIKDEKWINITVKSIILYHHERLDGSGFPLKNRNIPLPVLIVAVCDEFDDMICGISTKKYKVYEAIEYFKVFKGIKYDAKVVDTFLDFTAVYPAGSHVLTNEGEIAVVVAQNKDFQDRPVLRILKDKNGKDVNGEVIKDLIKINNIFIEKVLD